MILNTKACVINMMYRIKFTSLKKSMVSGLVSVSKKITGVSLLPTCVNKSAGR
jgi:hypothetical protein